MENKNFDSMGRCKTTGRLQAGHKFAKGRQKGSRNQLTQLMLDRVSEAGLSPEEVLISIYQDPSVPLDLRYKSASKILDIVHPKAASVDVTIDEKDTMTDEQVSNKIKSLLGTIGSLD